MKTETPPLLVFLCGARDFHAMDWFRSARQTLPNSQLCVLTDLIAGEGFKDLRCEGDRVYRLFILDPWLLRHQSSFGNVWRNLLKLVVFPLQVVLARRFNRQHPGARYYCHSMYYLFLAWAAGLHYVGTPQGSEVLIRPFRSRFYKYFATRSLRAAAHVTVDSRPMQQKIFEFSGVRAHVIQNGIDVQSILPYLNAQPATARKCILSIRGFTPLYRIADILAARNRSTRHADVPVALRYPFYEATYRTQALTTLKPGDQDVGRVELADIHRLFGEARLVVSIPVSDSSPKSVYEAIFYGCAVAIAHHPYYDDLPACMKARIILVDLAQSDWLDRALDKADEIVRVRYEPSTDALTTFDKIESFKKVATLIYSET
ncbi:MAG TPA: hypothetical protein VIV63_15220, partial [Steroidobacteraceae bacterium]